MTANRTGTDEGNAMRDAASAHRVLAAVVVACVSVLAACSGGGGGGIDVSVPEIVFGPESNVDSTLAPSADGFSFANFTAGQLPDLSFDTNEMTAMFGDGAEVCAEGSGDSCVLTAEASAWAQMINDARNSGHCEGFAVLAMERWTAGQQPPTGELQFTQGVVEGIMRGFATQFIGEVRAESAAWRKKSPRDVVAALTESLRDGKPDFVLGVYTDGGGHAVLPFKVEFPDDSRARISVYDSNWPGQERFVDVDLAANSWRFAFDVADVADEGAWTGGKGTIDLASLASRLEGSCPFCDDGAVERATILVIRSAAPGWSVTANGATVTADNLLADGVTATPTRAGLVGVEEHLVVIEPDAVAEGVSVSVPGVAVVHGVTPAGVIRADSFRRGATFDVSSDSVASATAGAIIRMASGDLAGEASGSTSEVSLAGDELELRATTADGRTAEFTVDDSAGAARLLAQTGENLPAGTASVVAIDGREPGLEIVRTLDDGSTVTERSDDDLELTPTTVGIDTALLGSTDATGLDSAKVGLLTLRPESEDSRDPDGNESGGETIDQSGDNGKMSIAMSWADIDWNALQMVNVYECNEKQPVLEIGVDGADARVTIEVRNFPDGNGNGGPPMTYDGNSAKLILPKVSVNKTFEILVRASTPVDGVIEVKAKVTYSRRGCSDG